MPCATVPPPVAEGPPAPAPAPPLSPAAQLLADLAAFVIAASASAMIVGLLLPMAGTVMWLRSRLRLDEGRAGRSRPSPPGSVSSKLSGSSSWDGSLDGTD
eukprot:EG_transcript_66556